MGHLIWCLLLESRIMEELTKNIHNVTRDCSGILNHLASIRNQSSSAQVLKSELSFYFRIHLKILKK